MYCLPALYYYHPDYLGSARVEFSPFPMPSGLCHKEDVVPYSAYATVSVIDKIAVAGRDKRECRTHILRGVVHVLLKCGTILFLIFDIVLYIGFH